MQTTEGRRAERVNATVNLDRRERRGLVRHTWLAAGSVAVLGGAGLVWVLAGPATARPDLGGEFTLTASTTNFEFGFVKNLQNAQMHHFAPGDTVAEREELRRGASVVGYDNLTCTATFDDNVLCTIVSVFPGRGTLHETVLIHTTTTNAAGYDPVDTVVTGGTGIFANKRGTAHVVGLSETDRTATYRLVD